MSADAGELATRRHEVAILYETIQDLTSTLSLTTVIERLLDRVLIHLDSEVASILIVGRDERLRISHAKGLPDEVVRETSLAPGDGISGYVFGTAEDLLIEDVESDPRFMRRNHERYYTNSAISVPLRIRGRVMGVLNVNNKRCHQPYNQEDLRLVQAIAGHAAVALSNAHLYEETLKQAQCDSLTGLANHGHFWSRLEIEFSRAQRYQRYISLVMLDVDSFKAFNDKFGHQAGDEALVGVARVIRACSRVPDFPARYGGEEFAMLLPDTPLKGAVIFAEKLRENIEVEAVEKTSRGRLTVSIGVGTYPDDADSEVALVETADSYLYQAKAGGRNTVRSSLGE